MLVQLESRNLTSKIISYIVLKDVVARGCLNPYECPQCTFPPVYFVCLRWKWAIEMHEVIPEVNGRLPDYLSIFHNGESHELQKTVVVNRKVRVGNRLLTSRGSKQDPATSHVAQCCCISNSDSKLGRSKSCSSRRRRRTLSNRTILSVYQQGPYTLVVKTRNLSPVLRPILDLYHGHWRRRAGSATLRRTKPSPGRSGLLRR